MVSTRLTANLVRGYSALNGLLHRQYCVWTYTADWSTEPSGRDAELRQMDGLITLILHLVTYGPLCYQLRLASAVFSFTLLHYINFIPLCPPEHSGTFTTIAIPITITYYIGIMWYIRPPSIDEKNDILLYGSDVPVQSLKFAEGYPSQIVTHLRWRVIHRRLIVSQIFTLLFTVRRCWIGLLCISVWTSSLRLSDDYSSWHIVITCLLCHEVIIHPRLCCPYRLHLTEDCPASSPGEWNRNIYSYIIIIDIIIYH